MYVDLPTALKCLDMTPKTGSHRLVRKVLEWNRSEEAVFKFNKDNKHLSLKLKWVLAGGAVFQALCGAVPKTDLDFFLVIEGLPDTIKEKIQKDSETGLSTEKESELTENSDPSTHSSDSVSIINQAVDHAVRSFYNLIPPKERNDNAFVIQRSKFALTFYLRDAIY